MSHSKTSQQSWTQRSAHRILKVGLALGLALFPSVGFSSINRAALVLARPSIYFSARGEMISADLITSYYLVKSQMKPFDMTQVIPADLQPGSDSGQIFARIADQSLSSIFNSPEVRATPLGQTATTVEQKMKQDVTLTQGQIQHKFTFQVQAFQSTARIDYQGYTNASLKYTASDSSVGLEVFEKVTKSQDLVLTQLNKPTDRVSSVSMRWNF